MEFRRIFDILLYQKLTFSKKVALVDGVGLNKEIASSSSLLENTMRVSTGGLDSGLNRGDRVAIISRKGSQKWIELDLGLQQVGVVTVPISPVLEEDIFLDVLADAQVTIAFVQDRETYDKLSLIKDELSSLKEIFTLEQVPDIKGWDDFVKEPTPEHHAQYETFRGLIHEDDLATIVYTSGTTGTPKGVMLSHKNMVSNIKSILNAVPLKPQHTVVSILPPHQIFERVAIYTYLAAGATVHFVSPDKTLMENLRQIKPHYFTSVPYILEEIYEGLIQGSLEKAPNSFKTLYRAIELGWKYRDYDKMSLLYFLKLKGVDFQWYQHWRKALGGRIEGIITGSDGLSPSLARLYSAAGIDIREGYGMAETAPVISLNRIEATQVNFGTVGIPLDGVDVKIAESKDEFGNGEILVRGDNVMMGYWNQNMPETEESEWLNTGDIGRFTEKKGFLQIAGRKDDVITLENGEKVHPLFLENQLRNSLFISQCIVMGEGKPQLSALLIPSFILLKLWSKKEGIEWLNDEEMLIHPRIKELFREEIHQINKGLSPREQITKFRLLPERWTLEKGELSPTLKKKREVILERFSSLIEEMYQS